MNLESQSTLSRRSLLRIAAVLPTLILLPAVPSTAATDVLSAFRKRYQDLTSVSFKFNSPTAQGSLQAQKGGKYRIVLKDRTLVSDGKTVWNAVTASKTVVIEPVRKHIDDTSLDQIFFLVFSTYQAKVASQTTSGGVIKLTPTDSSLRVGSTDTLELEVNNSGVIRSITVHEGNHATKWTIKDLKVNPRIQSSVFAFSVPTGWQVIDILLR